MFDAYGTTQNENGGSGNKVDFNALNEYVVETANLQTEETLIGYISQIIDLGTQEQPDAEVVFTGTEEDERQAVAEHPHTYFKNGVDSQTKKPVRLKCWPQKPIQCVAISVDFPDVIVDKGQFFGESNPLPLRLYLGGDFYLENHGMVVARPTPLKVNKKLGDWSFDVKHLCYQMALDSKLIGKGGTFIPSQIDQLLGKAFQFKVQVFFKENKGKKYYTEYVKYVGALGRGQSTPELLTTPMLLQFNKLNEEEAVRNLRGNVVNTMKRASNFDGSIIKGQLEKLGKLGKREEVNDEAEEKQEVAPPPQKEVKAKSAPKPPVVDDSDDSDIPF